LIEWARSNGIPYNPIPMGIYYDDPTMTPKQSQRCDACITVGQAVAAAREMRCIELAGGRYGVIEHLGPYSTIDQAFRKLADGIRASQDYTFRDDPPIEIFRRVHINGDASLNHTDIYFPVKRKGRE
jgi:AraC family transcriptional regulator